MVAAVGCYWVSGRDETWAPGANRQHGNSTDAQAVICIQQADIFPRILSSSFSFACFYRTTMRPTASRLG